MVENMKYSPLLLLLCCSVCAAQGLPADPTRPSGAEHAGAMSGKTYSGPRLESVYLPAKGRARAVIDGRLVVVGDEVGERKLVRITETLVVLEGPDGQEKLFLTPDVEKYGRTVKIDKRRVRE